MDFLKCFGPNEAFLPHARPAEFLHPLPRVPSIPAAARVTILGSPASSLCYMRPASSWELGLICPYNPRPEIGNELLVP